MSLTQRHSVWRRKKISTLTKDLMTHGNQEGQMTKITEYIKAVCVRESVCVCVRPVLSNSLWPSQKKSQRVWLQFTLISLNQVEWQYTSPLQPPGTVALQAPLPKKFSRQECWRAVVISYLRVSAWPRFWTHISCISCTGRQILYC